MGYWATFWVNNGIAARRILDSGGGDNYFALKWQKISGHIDHWNLLISYYRTKFEQHPYWFNTQFVILSENLSIVIYDQKI